MNSILSVHTSFFGEKDPFFDKLTNLHTLSTKYMDEEVFCIDGGSNVARANAAC